MKRLMLYSALLCAWVGGATMTDARPFSAKADARARATLAEWIDGETIPGLQYIMIDANGIVFEFNGGVTDVSTGEPVAADTVFMLNSSTKTISAAAILRLSAAGRLNLADPVSRYVEHPYGDELRIRHLLNQSSGIPNPLPLRWLHTPEEHASFDETRELETVLAENSELKFDPGTRYAYSNISYWLLGRVIEQVSGRSYCDFLRTEVFAALDIAPDELDCRPGSSERRATGHQPRWSLMTFFFWLMSDAGQRLASARGWWRYRTLLHNGPAYGGLYGTARGTAKFLADMLRPEPRLFGEQTRRLFFADQFATDGDLLETTPGWHRGRLGAGDHAATYFGKPGGGPGFSSNIRVYPDRRMASVLLMNRTQISEGPIHAFSDAIDAVFLEKRK